MVFHMLNKAMIKPLSLVEAEDGTCIRHECIVGTHTTILPRGPYIRHGYGTPNEFRVCR